MTDDNKNKQQPDLFAVEPTYKPGARKAKATAPFTNDVKYIKSIQDGKGRFKGVNNGAD